MDLCLDPKRKLSLLLFLHAGLTTQAAVGGGEGQGSQIDGGGWWPGRAGELGTQQTAGVPCATSPGTRPQPGRRQAPDSCDQCLLSQHDRYHTVPLSA